MYSFKNAHPFVILMYFVFVIGFSCFIMHPVCLAVSAISALLFSVMLNGSKGIKRRLMYIAVLMILTAIINPAFNHSGVTIITYFPNGNPLTYESIVYGIAASVMITSVVLWFSCLNNIMTSDKIMYLFGKILPSFSLIISMTLRFVPKFIKQLTQTINAQKCIGHDISCGNIIKRAKGGITVLSAMITRSLENSIDTADSMKSRGYGLSGRTSFSLFVFCKRDKIMLFSIILMAMYILFGAASGKMYCRYFPSISMAYSSSYEFSYYLIYFILCALPIISELVEEIT